MWFRLSTLSQGIEISGDIARISRADTHIGHGVARNDLLRALDPGHHVVRRIAQDTGDINAPRHQRERRTDKTIPSGDSGNDVASAAAILPYEHGAAFGIAAIVRGCRPIALIVAAGK